MNVPTTIYGYINTEAAVVLCPAHANESQADKDKNFQPLHWYEVIGSDGDNLFCDVCLKRIKP